MNAVYGGRIDNPFDTAVLTCYLKDYFNSQTLAEGGSRRPLGGVLDLPESLEMQDYLRQVKELSDTDQPSYFGLPANIQGVLQRNTSTQVISRLRVLMRPLDEDASFDRERWNAELSPILNLWKKLNKGENMHTMRLTPPIVEKGKKSNPLDVFIALERFSAVVLVQSIHRSLAALSKVIHGSALLSSPVQNLARSLLQQQVR